MSPSTPDALQLQSANPGSPNATFTPPQTGTDVALALGLMHVILNEGLEDRAYIAAMTHGFEPLAERAREYPPQRVAQWTSMTPAEIELLPAI